MDRYLVRDGILKALYVHREKLHGVLLDIGCGQSPYKKWLLSGDTKVVRYVGLDQEDNPVHDNQPDLCWAGTVIPVEDASIDSALCTEVLEHCPEPAKALAEIQRVLRPGGFLFFTTPFLWPLHEVPYDEYRYTPFSLGRLLKDAGFCEINITPLGGWDASLAQMIGLWARRRSSNRWIRVFWCTVLYPMYRILAWTDKYQDWDFQAGIMFTGLVGTARKPLEKNTGGKTSE